MEHDKSAMQNGASSARQIKENLPAPVLENPQAFSSIGKMIASTKVSAPKYGFGTGTRDHQLKVFQSKELCKTQFWGRTSPGPKYRYTDKIQYPDDPKWSFGSAVRPPLHSGELYTAA